MLRHQDGGFPSRRRLAPPGEAARAPLPRGPRQARRHPWRWYRGDHPAGWRSPYTEGRFSLHGGSLLPTRRIASPYTEGLGFLHGGCVGDIGLPLNCCQCCQYPIPIPNWPLATLGLATFSHWQHSPTTGETPVVHVGRVWYNTCHDHQAPTKWDDCPHGRNRSAARATGSRNAWFCRIARGEGSRQGRRRSWKSCCGRCEGSSMV